MILRIIYSAIFIKHFFQESSSFSFCSCLPSGWTILLLSGVATLISEKVFLDRENFWSSIFIHFCIGFAFFCSSAFVIVRGLLSTKFSVSATIQTEIKKGHNCILKLKDKAEDIYSSYSVFRPEYS
ncbi:protein RFT1-like protein isoform X1 [Gossypium australe]|uniref:Protein RFT1 homolog n=1 Tax=Gossypium australe TaxID=47621 RepID=A0A5B6USJ2_9ROSI|nr:protein RFT1-like protein isoform X1 [Gossypium australe]